MCVPDCAEGKRLLEAATQANPRSKAREDFPDHVKRWSVCNLTRGTSSEVVFIR
jgi:hypothetical protein